MPELHERHQFWAKFQACVCAGEIFFMVTWISKYRNLHRVLSFLLLVTVGQVALAGEAAVEFNFPDAMRAWSLPEMPSVPVTVRYRSLVKKPGHV